MNKQSKFYEIRKFVESTHIEKALKQMIDITDSLEDSESSDDIRGLQSRLKSLEKI